MFRGSFDHLIDQKGRVSIPARFREVIQASGRSQVVITRCPMRPPCLEIYSVAQWEEFEEQFLKLNRFNRAVMLFENFYTGNAQVCDIDKQGRMLVPPALREWAGLAKEVVVSGARDKFRLWDRKAWKEAQSEAEAAISADADFFNKLNL